jgi:hypothetical protein
MQTYEHNEINPAVLAVWRHGRSHEGPAHRQHEIWMKYATLVVRPPGLDGISHIASNLWIAIPGMYWRKSGRNAVVTASVSPRSELVISQIQASSFTIPSLFGHISAVWYFNIIGNNWTPKPTRDVQDTKNVQGNFMYGTANGVIHCHLKKLDTAQHIWKRNLRKLGCCANKQMLLVSES